MSVTSNAIRIESKAVDIEVLRARIEGEVVFPGEPGWDDARRAYNLALDQRPYAVVFVESADDVVAVVDFARDSGLRIAPQSTGHGATTLEQLSDTMLVKTSRMRGVKVDPEASTARVEAGALWRDATGPAGEHGLAALAGSAADIGVVGYSLGGGLGWLARRYGASANSVLAVEIVTADGKLVRAARDNEPDLFWAVRGGGGNFGVVTAIEIELYPVRELYAGAMFWPVERSEEILNAWREWVETVPDELTSVGRVFHFPPLDLVPEPLRGNSFVLVEAAFIGDENAGKELVRPLRERGPAIDTFAMIPAPALAQLHMDPPEPIPYAGDGTFLDDFPAEAVEAMVAADAPELLAFEVRHLGGAVATPSRTQGALGSIDSRFVTFAIALATTPEQKQAVESAVGNAMAALSPWASGRGYFNFAESAQSAAGLYPPATYKRLQTIRIAYDPGELFVANHVIPVRR